MRTPEREALNKARARRLAAAREQTELTRDDMAALAGVSPNTYYGHENGHGSLANAAPKYADILDVAAEWLLFGRNPPSWAVGEPEPSPVHSPNPNHIGAWCEHTGKTVEDLADQTGFTADMIRAWISGRITVSDKSLRLLAQAFGTTPGSILDVDPRVVAPALLDQWQKAVARQQEAQEALGLRAA